MHQEEITKTICIQKDLVLNTCNGRCVLEKKLTQLENHQKQSENNIKEKFELIVYIPISTSQFLINTKTASYQKEPFTLIPTQKYEANLQGIFHPPLA